METGDRVLFWLFHRCSIINIIIIFSPGESLTGEGVEEGRLQRYEKAPGGCHTTVARYRGTGRRKILSRVCYSNFPSEGSSYRALDFQVSVVSKAGTGQIVESSHKYRQGDLFAHITHTGNCIKLGRFTGKCGAKAHGQGQGAILGVPPGIR